MNNEMDAGNVRQLPGNCAEDVSMRIRLENGVSGRFKDLVVEESTRLNIFESVYENKGVKDACVRKWGKEIVEKVKTNKSEIVCVVSDDIAGAASRVLTVEELKKTSTKELSQLSPVSKGPVRLILQCVDRKNSADDPSAALHDRDADSREKLVKVCKPFLNSKDESQRHVQEQEQEMISLDQLKSIFPLHVLFNKEFTILQVGNGLPRLVKQKDVNITGQQMSKFFQITDPEGSNMCGDLKRLNKFSGQEFKLVHTARSERKTDTTNSRIRFRASMVNTSKDIMMFPLILDAQSVKDVNAMGLNLSQVPLSPAQRDALLVGEYLSEEVERTHKLTELSKLLDKETSLSNTLLYNMLPRTVVDDLRNGKRVEPKQYENVTLFFSDIVGFTRICDQVDPWKITCMLNQLYTIMDHLATKFNLYKVGTIGDAYMCCSGVPEPNKFHAENIANFAIAVSECVKQVKCPVDGSPIQLRIGIHTGICTAGVVGTQYSLFGDMVKTTCLHESTGRGGKIQCSFPLYWKLKHSSSSKDKYNFSARGFVRMKEKFYGGCHTYWLEGGTDNNAMVNVEALCRLSDEVVEVIKGKNCCAKSWKMLDYVDQESVMPPSQWDDFDRSDKSEEKTPSHVAALPNANADDVCEEEICADRMERSQSQSNTHGGYAALPERMAPAASKVVDDDFVPMTKLSPQVSSSMIDMFSDIKSDKKSVMKVRMENATSGRFKDLLVDISDEVNVFVSIYDNKAIKDAHVRKWRGDIAKDVKNKAKEIQCMIWDEREGRASHVLSLEDLKTTTTNQLSRLASESDNGRVRLILDCVERKKPAATESRGESQQEEGLSIDQLKNIYPLHILFDQTLSILQVGNGFPTLIKKNEVDIRGKHISRFLEITRPLLKRAWDWETLKRLSDQQFHFLHLMRTKNEPIKVCEIKFKASLVNLSNGKLMFILNLDARNMSDINAMGLTLSEVPMDSCQREAISLSENLSQEVDQIHELAKLSKRLENERMLSNKLLHNMLPKSIVGDLRNGRPVTPKYYENVTLFFSSIEGFTNISNRVDPLELIGMLNQVYSIMDYLAGCFNLYKVEAIGDTYMCCSGLPEPDKNHAENVANFAIAVLECVKYVKSPLDGNPVRLRIGMHTGGCTAGVVGVKTPHYCLFGDMINTTSRHESTGEAGKIQCSSALFKHLNNDYSAQQKEQYHFTCRGFVGMKGKGQRNTYWLEGGTDDNVSMNVTVIQEFVAKTAKILANHESQTASPYFDPESNEFKFADSSSHLNFCDDDAENIPELESLKGVLASAA